MAKADAKWSFFEDGSLEPEIDEFSFVVNSTLAKHVNLDLASRGR
jgi:hypothetical protein